MYFKIKIFKDAPPTRTRIFAPQDEELLKELHNVGRIVCLWPFPAAPSHAGHRHRC
jgi:hypothetical protein